MSAGGRGTIQSLGGRQTQERDPSSGLWDRSGLGQSHLPLASGAVRPEVSAELGCEGDEERG